MRDIRRSRVRKRPAGTVHRSDSYQRIWETVARIPRGRVSTYGAIAAVAGLPGQARLAGYALHHLPEGFDIPWHRVINAAGRISFPPGSRHHTLQRMLLEREGVEFMNHTVDLRRFGWTQQRQR